MYDINIAALLDNGANKSVVGSESLKILEHFNLNVNGSGMKEITTADGRKQCVQGIVDLPVNMNDHIQIIAAVIGPSLP